MGERGGCERGGGEGGEARETWREIERERRLRRSRGWERGGWGKRQKQERDRGTRVGEIEMLEN